MNWSFRTKLQLFAGVLTTFGIGILAVFFLRLYAADKQQNVIERERLDSARSAQALENLVSTARGMEASRLENSSQIILLADNLCNPAVSPLVTVSKSYEGHFRQLRLDPRAWPNSFGVFSACQHADRADVFLVEFKPRLMVPYLGFLMKDRLALLSMEGFQTSTGSTQILLDSAGDIVWSADGQDFVAHAMEEAKISAADLKSIAFEASQKKTARTRAMGSDGLIAFAPVLGYWTLVSISYLPTLTRSVTYAFLQCFLLAIVVLCLSLLLGRKLADLLLKPIDDLKVSAEQIGAGKLNFRFENLGNDEFSTVKTAMNSMIEKIGLLIEDCRKSTSLESELDLTRKVQTLLFPKTSVNLPKLALSSYFAFAEHCGGDWWGYLETLDPENKPLTIVMIGDVTGHGAPSALMTAAARGAVSVIDRWLKLTPSLVQDPATMLSLINQSVFDAGKGTMNMTFFIVVLDHTRQKLHCSNAAHLAGYLLHPLHSPAGQGIHAIGKASRVLGESADTVFNNESYDWYPGSKLFLYTDGLVDVLKDDTNLFDRKILRKAIQASQSLSGSGLIQQILSRRKQVALDLPNVDDVTVVVCESLRDAT